jgi:hypothetical protein
MKSAEFSYRANDVARFAVFGATEHGQPGTQLRIHYLWPSGDTGPCFPNRAAVQRTPARDINCIIETKGREWEGTAAKDEAIRYWG